VTAEKFFPEIKSKIGKESIQNLGCINFYGFQKPLALPVSLLYFLNE
jgi:hypothetical protein